MKVFVLEGVLCDYTCGCIVVAAENKEQAIEIITERNPEVSADVTEVSADVIEWHEALEEVTEGYYLALWGGG